jgi:hypothetical protein
MTLAEAARYLHTTPAVLASHIASGKLPAMPLDKTLVLHRSHLDKFVKDSAVERAVRIRREREAAEAAQEGKQGAAPGGPSDDRNGSRRCTSGRGGHRRARAHADTGVSETQPHLPGLEPQPWERKEPR